MKCKEKFLKAQVAKFVVSCMAVYRQILMIYGSACTNRLLRRRPTFKAYRTCIQCAKKVSLYNFFFGKKKKISFSGQFPTKFIWISITFIYLQCYGIAICFGQTLLDHCTSTYIVGNTLLEVVVAQAPTSSCSTKTTSTSNIEALSFYLAGAFVPCRFSFFPILPHRKTRLNFGLIHQLSKRGGRRQ